MNRIQVSTNASGTGDLFTFPINPQDVDLQDSYDIVGIDTLDGSKVYQQSVFDSRPRKLIWKGVSGHSGASLNVEAMVASVRSWIGEVRYFNFRDLNIINATWPVANNWKKCRVVDLKGKMKEQSYYVYSSLELTIQPEQ